MFPSWVGAQTHCTGMTGNSNTIHLNRGVARKQPTETNDPATAENPHVISPYPYHTYEEHCVCVQTSQKITYPLGLVAHMAPELGSATSAGMIARNASQGVAERELLHLVHNSGRRGPQTASGRCRIPVRRKTDRVRPAYRVAGNPPYDSGGLACGFVHGIGRLPLIFFSSGAGRRNTFIAGFARIQTGNKSPSESCESS